MLRGISSRFCTIGRSHIIVATQQRRNFGIGDTLMNMATKKVEQGKEKQFTQMLEMMISVPKWTLRPWKTTMESQLGSWTMYIPGVGSSNEMKEMKSFKDMIDAMTDEEIDHPLEKLNGTARERISRSTGKSTDDVTRLLFFFKQSLIVSTWLQERKKANEVLPTTELELLTLQETDPRVKVIAAKIMNPKKTKKWTRSKITVLVLSIDGSI